MFNFAVYNQNYPIIAQDLYSLASLLVPNQYQCHSPQITRHWRSSKPTNRVSNALQIDTQQTALKEGLQKSLDKSKKKLSIPKKMGYEDGVGITKSLETKSVSAKEAEIISSTKESSSKSQPAPSGIVTKREKRLLQVQKNHKKDIELLRLRLKAESASKTSKVDSMIVAHIAIEDESISDEIFEIIHQYLVNSLHVYTGSPFPIFHDIAHVEDEIKVVCEDKTSLEYLSTCIAALSANLSVPMTTTRNSPIGNNVYLFSVKIQGKVTGSKCFFMQLKKHSFQIKPDHWIVVSQNPCPKTNKTNLQILIDEYSAMSLIFRYNLKLFVCMQEMQFELEGKIPI